MGKLLFEDITYNIIGACMSVHKGLGAGFLESVYHEVLEKEFEIQKVNFESKKKLQVYCNGAPLQLNKDTEAQTINYLKSTNYPLGLLINFARSSLTWKRFINTK